MKIDDKFIRDLLNDYQAEVRQTILFHDGNRIQKTNHLDRKFKELKENISLAGVSV